MNNNIKKIEILEESFFHLNVFLNELQNGDINGN